MLFDLGAVQRSSVGSVPEKLHGAWWWRGRRVEECALQSSLVVPFFENADGNRLQRERLMSGQTPSQL